MKLDLSVVIPVFNEEENLVPLTEELVKVVGSLPGRYEIVFVDDGSTDRSPAVLDELRRRDSNIRLVRFKKNAGQTAAFEAGFAAARYPFIVTMDADLQNDPADIPALLEKAGEYDLVCGWRQKRRDTFVRRASSIIANGIRNRLSGEEIRDVGCSLKVFRAERAKALKLYTGMHRFFPTLVKIAGGRVVEVPVNHRPRKFGTTKYNIRNRMMRSFLDLLAVCWMKRRYMHYEIQETKE